MAGATEFRIGLEMKLYYLTTGTRATWPGAAPANLSLIDLVRDLTITADAGESDVTTRGGGGWRQIVPTIKDFSLEGSMIYKPGTDVVFDALKTSYLNQTVVGYAALDGDKATIGAKGFWFDGVITQWTQNEPLEEGVTIDFRIRNTISDVPLELVTVTT